MSKPKAQGTAWETAFVHQAQGAGLAADRLPEGGIRDVGDVWLGDLPTRNPKWTDIPIVAWSRLVDTGTSRRGADGERSVVVIGTEDFLRIALQATVVGNAFVVECKATERLNVTRALANTRRKLAAWKA